MIKNMDEFAKQYPNAVIVNYDWYDLLDMECGLCYRTSKHFTEKQSMEKLRKYKDKYITYPYIQEYQSLVNPRIDLFILHNKKCYKLKRKDYFTYSIEKEIDVIEDFYKDDIFFKYIGKVKARKPKIINEELLKIEE